MEQLSLFWKVYVVACFVSGGIGAAISIVFIAIGLAALPFIFGFLK